MTETGGPAASQRRSDRVSETSGRGLEREGVLTGLEWEESRAKRGAERHPHGQSVAEREGGGKMRVGWQQELVTWCPARWMRMWDFPLLPGM